MTIPSQCLLLILPPSNTHLDWLSMDIPYPPQHSVLGCFLFTFCTISINLLSNHRFNEPLSMDPQLYRPNSSLPTLSSNYLLVILNWLSWKYFKLNMIKQNSISLPHPSYPTPPQNVPLSKNSPSRAIFILPVTQDHKLSIILILSHATYPIPNCWLYLHRINSQQCPSSLYLQSYNLVVSLAQVFVTSHLHYCNGF